MTSNARTSFSRWLAWASAALYAASLFSPAYYTESQAHYGLEALLLGSIGVLDGHFSWFANPLLCASWFKRKAPTYGLSFAFAVPAFGLAVSFLLGEKIAVGSAGEYAYRAGTGYYLWLASIGLAALAAWVCVPSTTQRARSSDAA